MFSDSEILAAKARLKDGANGAQGKLSGSDIDSLIGAFRQVLGPLEDAYSFNLQSTLESLDDTTNDKERAAKMAAGLIRLIDQDFDVSTLDTTIVDDANTQRRLFIISMIGLIWKLPAELSQLSAQYQAWASRGRTGSIPMITVR